ncbi:hypothetical protein [Streptomyces sp. AK02-01A]|uniref:hypothetical protein n=1 Tax=Streptomyces sp. AK02-01A TaxID=3028648 RepID=UPI0029BF9EEC|nr:hypothetical protein [Streptomyces sp. AK02-01A]MDX3854144.1 hypothetical protein [Streptomyces sp. AK02-01A]
MSEREYWANVAKRPGMFLGQVTLARLEAYVDGYAAHAQRHGGPGLDDWRQWLVARRGRECSHAWHIQVRHLALPEGSDFWDLSADQEQHIIKVLFALLDEFLAERATGAPTV